MSTNEIDINAVNARAREKQTPSVDKLSPLKLASIFHDTYEAFAPAYGYETRKETRDFEPESPNGKLMEVVCKFIIDTEITQALTDQRTALLTELRDSGLLEEKVNYFRCMTLEAKCDGHNTLAKAMKAHINNLIKPDNL